MPWTVYRYMATEALRVMMMSLVAISLVGSVVLAYQLARSGIRLGFLWPVLLKSLAYPLFFSLPVSFLFGITLGIGRLASDLEINALRAHGVSHFQLALPIGVVAAALTVGSLYLNGEVIPAIHYEKGNLRDAILAQLEELGSGTNRSLLLPRDGRLFVESYSGTRLRGVHLEVNERIGRRLSRRLREGREGRRATERLALGRLRARPTLLAKECDLEISTDRTEIILHLRGVKVQLPQSVTRSDRQPDVFRQTVSIGNFKLALPFMPRGERVKDRSWRDLFAHRDDLAERLETTEHELECQRVALDVAGDTMGPPSAAAASSGGTITDEAAEIRATEQELDYIERRWYDAETEIFRRITFGLASLTFALVALPLILLTGARGRLIPFFLGNVFVVLPFFLLVMLGVKLGEGGIAPSVAVSLPNVLLLGVGGFLWAKAVKR